MPKVAGERSRQRPDRLVEVWTADQPSARGYTFDVGKQYRVFASRLTDGRLVTSVCSATTVDNSQVPIPPYPELLVEDVLDRWQLGVMLVFWVGVLLAGCGAAGWIVARGRR
jgi:hypothetical protein